jgi:hypothetical protein
VYSEGGPKQNCSNFKELNIQLQTVEQGGLKKKDYLGVVNSELSTLLQQSLCNKDSWALTCVTCVFLEGKAKQSNALASNSVEHPLQHVPREPLLLKVIQCYHLVPVHASSSVAIAGVALATVVRIVTAVLLVAVVVRSSSCSGIAHSSTTKYQ